MCEEESKEEEVVDVEEESKEDNKIEKMNSV